MDASEFPDFPADLIAALDKRFPERTPGPTETLDQIRFASGQRFVVRMLKAVFDEQNQTSYAVKVEPDV